MKKYKTEDDNLRDTLITGATLEYKKKVEGYTCTECGIISEKPFKCIHTYAIKGFILKEMEDEFIAKCIDSGILDVILAGKINEIVRYLNMMLLKKSKKPISGQP